METRRWTNPSQPQTLYLASVLLYIDAAFLLLGLLIGGGIGLIGLALLAGAIGAGFGIANEKKWGYYLGVLVATVGLLPYLFVLWGDPGALFNITFLINLVFPVALFALLVHPMSRDYQRIWFK